MDAAFATQTPARAAIDLESLYLRHRPHLLNFVLHYVRKPEDSEDVVQNTFIEAMRCADRFAGLSKPSTWLFGIALNLARSHMRKNRGDRFISIEDDLLDQIPDERADPAFIAELREIVGKVGGLLNRLPENICTTFEAVVDSDATYEDVAARLDIPVGTVRSRVSRVRTAARAACL